MPSTILSDNGVSSGTAGIKTTGSNDGQLALQTTTAGGTATTAITIDTSQNVTFAQTANLPNTFGFKNRIINGDMRIDQRNAGAAVTASGAFPVDRFVIGYSMDGAVSLQQDSSAPTGFVNSVKFTTTTADASLSASQYVFFQQKIEGTNISDLAWGTASAKTITLSFWVRSSLTGTFGGSLVNGGFNRSYPFTYTISTADTWEQKSVTIAGDTTGTWLTTTGVGIRVNFGLGVGSTFSGTAGAWAASELYAPTGATSVIGTLNATWYITGVQLEVGPSATSFDYRPYGTELALCQRYYYRIKAVDGSTMFGSSFNYGTTSAIGYIKFPVDMRTNPTALEQSGTATDYRVFYSATSTNCSSVPTFDSGTLFGATATFTVASGLTAGQGSMLRANTSSAYLGWSAEL